MMLVEALVGPAVEAGVNVGADATISVLDKLAYWKNLKRHYEELIQEAKNLWALRDVMKAEISKNRRSRDTTKWIAEVEMKKSEVEELANRYHNRKNHTLGLRYRIDLSKNMAVECKQVHSLWEAGKRLRGEFDAELPDPVVEIPAPRTEHNPSQHKVVEELVNLLEDTEISTIGIWGTVGVGKTVIMKNLNNRGEIAKMFGMVIWVTVSKDWSIESLQHQIMRRLKLNVGRRSTEIENAEMISEEFKEKKCLILLDDVYHYIELDQIIGVVNGNHKCKVVLASRDQGLCKEMDVDEIINVKPLSSSEAFNMFRGIVGKHIFSPGIKPMAELVLRECGGLPILIDMLAKAFRRMSGDFQLWKRGRGSLRNWMNMEGMDEVLEVLKFCYECLDSDAKKNCFLYSALYPEECEIYIHYLLECWRVEGFVDDGQLVLKHLLDFSLLENSGNKKSVKMNKVLRKMALKLLSTTEDSKFLAKPREGLYEPPNPEEWKQVSRISLMDNKFSSLPETPNCCDLLTLLLQKNKNLITIPEFFFTSMRNLRVLDLHGTGIKSLPPSLCSLICLKGLYLNSCINLVELPTDIDELTQLEVLDIRGTRLGLFQITNLTWLKLLRISLSIFGMGSHTDQKQSGTVVSFVSLEEFSVDIDSSLQWWDRIGNSIVEELATLKKLTSLQFCFPTMHCLGLFVRTNPAWKDFFERTESAWEDFLFAFRFVVGSHSLTCYDILESFDDPSYNCLKFINCQGTNHVIFSKVLAKTQAFALINHKGFSRLSDFYMESMNNLIICSIEGCNDIETIVDGMQITDGVLESLQHLQIKHVLKLESIWQGPVHAGSLTHLKTLTLVKCPQLKKIFSNGLIQQLSKLEDLRVENCDQIEEIIAKLEKDGLESNQLPRLKTLTLLDLPKLRLICADDSWQWRALQRVEISLCHMLKSLPFNYFNATKLRYIQGQRAWWEVLEWKDEGVKRRLESLCILN